MTMWKRAAASTLAVVMLGAALAGCSGSSDKTTPAPATNTPAPAAEKKEINVFNLKVEIDPALKVLAADYEKEKGVKVNIKSCGGGCDYGAQLKAEFQSGKEPDVFVIGGPGELELWKHKVADMSGEKWVAQVNPDLLGLKLDGKIVGFPVAIEGYGLIYNKAILDKAGVKPEEIKSYATLEAAFKAIDAKKKDLGLDAVVSLTTKETWVTGLHNLNILFAARDNATQFTQDVFAGKVDLTKDSVAKDYAKMFKLLVDYSDKAKLESNDYNAQVAAFGTSKTAFLHQGNWVYPNLKDLQVTFDMGFVPLAINDTKYANAIPVGVPSYYVVNKDSKFAAESKAFLEYIAMTERGHKYMISEAFMVPAFKNVKLEPTDPLAKSIMKFNAEGRTLTWQFTSWPDGWGMREIGPMLAQFAKDGNADKLLGDMDTAAKAAVKK
ncbi:MAG TPA: ABC transporter substrate-binding protein [Symbiobacteriaceae bacterium]|nr:ABC transporter substrate-binding protein [Symbiobacteriaceae bacterium]